MKDPRSRLPKSRGEHTRLGRIWSSKKITRRTKTKALLLSVLLYRCKTWKMNKEDDKAMDGFQHKCLRRILNINWKDHISNKEVLKRASMEQLSREVKKIEMEDDWPCFSIRRMTAT